MIAFLMCLLFITSSIIFKLNLTRHGVDFKYPVGKEINQLDVISIVFLILSLILTYCIIITSNLSTVSKNEYTAITIIWAMITEISIYTARWIK